MHIVQRGAVRPLIEMLQSPDVQLREMSAFALGRLAQVTIFLSFCFNYFSCIQGTKIPVIDETMLHLLAEFTNFIIQNTLDLVNNDFIVA